MALRIRPAMLLLGCAAGTGCTPFRYEPPSPRTETFPGLTARVVRADATLSMAPGWERSDRVFVRTRAAEGTRLRGVAVVPLQSTVCGMSTIQRLRIDGRDAEFYQDIGGSHEVEASFPLGTVSSRHDREHASPRTPRAGALELEATARRVHVTSQDDGETVWKTGLSVVLSLPL